jgi:hypothetical protein
MEIINKSVYDLNFSIHTRLVEVMDGIAESSNSSFKKHQEYFISELKN